MYASIGESFEHTEMIDEETVSEFAHLIGDLNPLHHDRPAAEASRFGGIIASGHTTYRFFWPKRRIIFPGRHPWSDWSSFSSSGVPLDPEIPCAFVGRLRTWCGARSSVGISFLLQDPLMTPRGRKFYRHGGRFSYQRICKVQGQQAQHLP